MKRRGKQSVSKLSLSHHNPLPSHRPDRPDQELKKFVPLTAPILVPLIGPPTQNVDAILPSRLLPDIYKVLRQGGTAYENIHRIMMSSSVRLSNKFSNKRSNTMFAQSNSDKFHRLWHPGLGCNGTGVSRQG